MTSLSDVLTRCSAVPEKKYNIERSTYVDRSWMPQFFRFDDGTNGSLFNGINVESSSEITRVIRDMLYQYEYDGNHVYYEESTGSLMTRTGLYKAGWFISPTVDEIKTLVSEIGTSGHPNIAVVAGKDIGIAHIESISYELFQGASQFNALEMINMDMTPHDGIEIYTNDNTQGPRTALACAPGTFLRNYWVTDQQGEQFNSLKYMGLSHLNGYLVWGTDPDQIIPKLNPDKLMIPCMIYTQVAGVTVSNRIRTHSIDKLVHQVYSSGVPINTYRNGGNLDSQLYIAKTIITAQYIGAIGMGILLHTFDTRSNRTTLMHPRINLTLLGAGAFRVPSNTIYECISDAINVYKDYSCNIYIHGHSTKTANDLSKAFNIPIVPFGTDLSPNQIPQPTYLLPTVNIHKPIINIPNPINKFPKPLVNIPAINLPRPTILIPSPSINNLKPIINLPKPITNIPLPGVTTNLPKPIANIKRPIVIAPSPIVNNLAINLPRPTVIVPSPIINIQAINVQRPINFPNPTVNINNL